MLEFVMENGGVTFPVVAPTPIPPTPTPMPPNGCLHEGTANGVPYHQKTNAHPKEQGRCPIEKYWEAPSEPLGKSNDPAG